MDAKAFSQPKSQNLQRENIGKIDFAIIQNSSTLATYGWQIRTQQPILTERERERERDRERENSNYCTCTCV